MSIPANAFIYPVEGFTHCDPMNGNGEKVDGLFVCFGHKKELNVVL